MNAEGTKLVVGSKTGAIHLWDISALQKNEVKSQDIKEVGVFTGHSNTRIEKLMFITDKNGNNFKSNV